MPTLTRTVSSPIGLLRVVVHDGALVRVDLPGTGPDAAAQPSERSSFGDEVARQLAQYFRGERLEFELPLAPEGTPFQLAAWEALRTIPFGETRSYAEQAERIGRPRAVRAVGAANGKNPLPIVVPCHRVIGKDGSLTGFGGGLPAKRWLLDHETRVLQRSAARSRT